VAVHAGAYGKGRSLWTGERGSANERGAAPDRKTGSGHSSQTVEQKHVMIQVVTAAPGNAGRANREIKLAE